MTPEKFDEAEHRKRLEDLKKPTRYNVVKILKFEKPDPNAKGETITKVRCEKCGVKRIIEQEPECSCDPERMAAEKANREQAERNRAKVLGRDGGGDK